jgi:hypothetical protein
MVTPPSTLYATWAGEYPCYMSVTAGSTSDGSYEPLIVGVVALSVIICGSFKFLSMHKGWHQHTNKLEACNKGRSE